ncbi:hypothetical protein GQX73_g10918 [Xylaria multiplex]|uniref:Uncharacterized protein n=1 Tax=Xylaria multiplex TaxID=323545 RepID=A0A7C8MLW6_9PEZI|nr:hypothetical protein GQX73_g10918 [Xylaria multiplex]
MPTDLTAEWGDKLAELVAKQVENPLPAENAVNARLTGIDETGTAALVSKLKRDAGTYGGFALVFHHATNYQNFEWLQFITRQLVVDNTAVKGNLVFKTNTVSYQLVDSVPEITDYTFASGSKPVNWDTCWKVDSGILPKPRPFFREQYDYVISPEKKLTAILDAPSPTGGKKVQEKDPLYEDAPAGSVEMGAALGSKEGISRAYFSDYLVKKDGAKWRIVARFDFNLTWNPVTKNTSKENFTLHVLKSTATTELLDCHKAALRHKITNFKPEKNNTEPWKSFYDSIYL